MSKCQKCGGTGYLPFIKEDGSVSKYARIFCDCHPQYGIDRHEHYEPLTPEMFDFPMSWDMWRSICYEHNWSVPPPAIPVAIPIQAKEQEEAKRHIVYEHSELTPKNVKRLGQIEGELTSIKKVIRSLKPARKPPENQVGQSDEEMEDITDRFYRG